MTETPVRHGALRAHVAECEACRADPPPVEGIEAVLAAAASADPTALSRRTMVRMQPELARRARAVYWRAVTAAVLVGLVPLPVVLLYNAYVLRLVYQLMAAVLPVSVAGYLVVTYAAFAVLLYGVTYAAVPVLMGRRHRIGTTALM